MIRLILFFILVASTFISCTPDKEYDIDNYPSQITFQSSGGNTGGNTGNTDGNNEGPCQSGLVSNANPTGDFTTLIWADEFDTGSSFCIENWTAEIGTGCPNLCGWGNGEAQYYTAREDNVKIEDGILKIKAKKENYQNSQYTSTRIKTQGKFDFTYGKVEVRAKLPTGGGTWPAIWMLGSNITTVSWPACGEIDIMEHVGNDQNSVHSSLHTPSSYGGTINTSTYQVNNASEAFNVYAMQWDANKIEFFLNGNSVYTYQPNVKNDDTWPFNSPQFLLLNVAMGGSFGGTIDPNFSESAMEIDYVRVYQ